MFFSFSKISWFLIQPLTMVLILLAIGMLALFFNARIFSLMVLLSAFFLVVLCGFTTLGAVLLNPLEERFQRSDVLPADITGIILLGGYMSGEINAARGGTEINSAGDRVVEAMRLAKYYKDAKIVVTGGNGTYFNASKPDADSTRTLFSAFGVDDHDVVYESKSRNTIENAKFSYDLVQPQKGQRWLLVTSAYHMPRSVGVFRKAGFEVIAWPVDYKTVPVTRFEFYFQNANEALSRTSTAIHEWLGLLIYWWKGEIDYLFPKP